MALRLPELHSQFGRSAPNVLLSPEKTCGPGEAPYLKQLADYTPSSITSKRRNRSVLHPLHFHHGRGRLLRRLHCQPRWLRRPQHVTYGFNGVGEINYDFNAGALAAGDLTPFSYHFDAAATTGTTTPFVGTGFASNHGDIQPEIARTYVGMVGPGIAKLGVTRPNQFFADHVDVRPTLMYLTGLQNDYAHDGRVNPGDG